MAEVATKLENREKLEIGRTRVSQDMIDGLERQIDEANRTVEAEATM